MKEGNGGGHLQWRTSMGKTERICGLKNQAQKIKEYIQLILAVPIVNAIENYMTQLCFIESQIQTRYFMSQSYFFIAVVSSLAVGK